MVRRGTMMSDQHAEAQWQHTDGETIAEIIEMLQSLDNTRPNQMSPLFYQQWFEQLNMSIRDLLRIIGHDVDASEPGGNPGQ
jgi:hypothetical protein